MTPHTTSTPRRRRRTLIMRGSAVLAAALMFAAGCSAAGGDADDAVDGELASSGPVGIVDADGPPREGGSIAFGEFSFPQSLDPTRTQVSGYTGGTTMAAVYDLLMRYDPGADRFVPQLAEDMVTVDDGQTWTMTLRDEVTFSDGTAVDADAVVSSIDRYVAHNGAAAQLWQHVVDDTAVRDPRTIEFTLDGRWDRFPVLFTQGLGMVVGPGVDDADEYAPVGAGPFTVDRFAPGDEIVLRAREDYWAGRPHLDQVRVLPFDDDRSRADSLAAGQLDATILLHPKLVSELLDDEVTGYLGSQPMGQTMMINHRAGRAGADPRVRRAIVAAVDPALIDQRVDAGVRASTGEVFPADSPLAPQISAAGYDPDLARDLLAQARADGYDGRLEYISVPSPEGRAAALATQAMLEAVGFEVSVEYPGSQTDVIRRAYVEHDFDLMAGAVNADPAAPYLGLYGALAGDSSNNVLGYQDARTDELLEQLRADGDDAARRATVTALQERLNETAPLVNYGARSHLAAWNPRLHGVDYSYSAILLLGEAWLEE